MENSKNTILQNPAKPLQHLQESLSLRDLPLNADKLDSTGTTVTTEDHLEPSFEFLTSTSCDFSPAENIIFAGKLIPLNYQNTLLSPQEHITPRIRARSESLSALQGDKLNHQGNNTVTNRDNVRPMRTSRSLDSRKLTREEPKSSPSPVQNTRKQLETSSFGSGKSLKPRWYVIMFGMVKFPKEIELKDIKSRQVRRNIPQVNRRTRSPSPSPSWRFLNALSCKDPTSVAATTPFWIPHP